MLGLGSKELQEGPRKIIAVHYFQLSRFGLAVVGVLLFSFAGYVRLLLSREDVADFARMI